MFHVLLYNSSNFLSLYYSLIADIYTLAKLPDMVFDDRLLSWNYESTDYYKKEQMKRVESWMYNYKKKLNR